MLKYLFYRFFNEGIATLAICVWYGSNFGTSKCAFREFRHLETLFEKFFFQAFALGQQQIKCLRRLSSELFKGKNKLVFSLYLSNFSKLS